MNRTVKLVALLMLGSLPVVSQANPPNPKGTENYSGMYMFLRDGEFVQITVEDRGRVTGFISRYGDEESDRGVFLNQFFKEGKLEGTELSFVTQVVHGVWFEFKGQVARGPGKTLQDEAYYLLQGTLIESRWQDKKVSSTSHQVIFKSFPRDKEAKKSPPPAQPSGSNGTPSVSAKSRPATPVGFGDRKWAAAVLQQVSCSRLSFRPLRFPSTVTAIDSV
jgi:hypothetical protein